MRVHSILIGILLAALPLLNPSAAHAEAFGLDISPIVGFDRSQTLLPTPHSTTRLVYGVQVTAGILLISAEAQYTRGISQETFDDLSQTDTADKVKVGIRSGFRLFSLASFYLRAGVQASQHRYDQTQGDVTTSSTTAVAYAPYGGAGLKASLTSKIWANVDVVAVIPNVNNMAQNEYQIMAGFGIHLP